MSSETVDHEREREALRRELEEHRRRLDELLSPEQPMSVRLARVGGDGFPRSRTMRLLIGQPLLLAGLSALAMRVLGPRAMRLLPLAGLAARTTLSLLRPMLAQASRPAGVYGGSDDQGKATATGRNPPQGHAAQGAGPKAEPF
ncbi:MAG TPA: hypothetical protein VFA75_08685 [Nevskia sp.]|nr:hypothetical protein [Nevskia sp.]